MIRRTDLKYNDNIFRYCEKCEISSKPDILEDRYKVIFFICPDCGKKIKMLKGNSFIIRNR